MDTETIDVLVTGASGFLGRWLLAALTARGYTVGALLRGAEGRRASLAAFVQEHGGDPSRVVALEGDIEAPSLGLDGDFSRVRFVYHLAARFAFGLSTAEAYRSNVEGSLEVARWARARPALERFVMLGGYRMTRPEAETLELQRGPGPERRERLYRARGAYEGSKHEAHGVVERFARQSGLPWTVVHPSSVIGDSRSGETSQLTGLGELVLRLSRRQLPALVGSADTFVPLVTVDYLAAFLVSVIERPETVSRELTVLDPETPPLPALIRHIAGRLGVPAPRLRLPVWLVAALPAPLTGVDPESLSFLSTDRYDTGEADAHARAIGLVRPDILQSVDRWCDFLVASRFLGAAPA